MNDPEVGRELRFAELVPRTVYVLQKGGRPLATFWFMGEVAGHMAEFFAGHILVTLLLFIQDDGTFKDDSGAKIAVHEYLGEV